MKSKSLIAILLTFLLLITILVVPISAGALSSTHTDTISITWEPGQLSLTDGQIGTPIDTDSAQTNFIRTKYIDVSEYTTLKITNTVSRSARIFFYSNNNTNTVADSAQSVTINTTERSITVPDGAVYLRMHIYNAPITTSDYSGVVLKGDVVPIASLIDESKTGTLKVYKYEMEDTSTATTYGTGLNTDLSNVPANATPLAGVTFTIKKVAEVSSTYYREDGVALPTATQAKNMSAIGSTRTLTTNSSGYAILENLPLGIYYVTETSAPAHVVSKAADFVISLPMTSVDGTEWEYEVSVFPKNQTKYETITIEKSDYADGAAIPGAKFTIKKNTANNNWNNATTVESNITTDEFGEGYPTNPLPVNMYYQITETQAASSYIYDMSSITRTIYLNEDGYICNPTTKDVLDSENPKTLKFTNTKPQIEKFIDNSRGNNTNLVNSASIVRYNDDNNFQYYTVKVTTPNVTYMSALRTFKVTDTIKNTAIQPELTKIVDGNGNTLATNAYTYTATTSSTTWNKTYDTTVTFDTSKIAKNTDYYISYKCFLVGNTTISNTASVTYSNTTDTSVTDTTDTTESNTVYYFVFLYKFTKTAPDGTGLAGAEFQVFRSKEDAVALRNPIVGYDWNSTNPVITRQSYSSGVITFNGFDCGNSSDGEETFWLVETKAPSGYNLLSEPVAITVNKTTGTDSMMDVINSRKLTLPNTGGQGMIMFTAIGIAFLMGAGILSCISRKKKDV